MKSVPVLYTKKEDCCGCTLCSQVCPRAAITMKMDAEGFLYPVIDENICIGCNRCTSACAFKSFKADNDMETKFFACGLKDKEKIAKSSSGGMFTALSDVVLNDGGAVACSIYDCNSHSLNFHLVTDKESRNTARGSKYLQSNPKDIFAQCESWLINNQNKKLLFVGTGCQAEGFRKFAEIKKLRDRVYIVDLICHGTPSPQLWKDYVSYLETTNSVKVDCIDFKDKRKGWEKPTAIAKSGEKEFSLNEFLRMFHQNYILRPACYSCPYSTVARNTDITIGDFWGIDKKIPHFDSYLGASVALIQSKKGMELLDSAKTFLNVVKSNREDCMQFNLQRPSPKPENREAFWQDYKEKDIGFVAKKYGKLSLLDRAKSKAREVVNKLK